jgi:hypothetical protein
MTNCIGSARERRAAPEAEPARLMFQAAPEVKASLHADGMVLIHHGSGTVFSANRVGAMIWQGATEHRSMGEMAESISGEFHLPRQTVEQDALRFLAELQAAGLLLPDRS